MNTIIIIGNLGNDPKLQETKNGKSICTFPIANTVGWGEHKKTVWFEGKAFGKTADNCQTFLSKGSKVAVEGTCIPETWEYNGKTYYKTVINISNIEFLNTKGQQNKPEPTNDPIFTENADNYSGPSDSEIPF